MHIVDSLKEAVSDDPAIRAQKIISELVSPLGSSDQAIIHDLVSLIRALANNPSRSVDVTQIKQTAQLLIDELIKPIPNPNKQLADQLLEVVVSAAKKEVPKSAPQPQTEVAKPAQAKQEQVSDSVLKLLTGEIKELVRKHQALDMFTKEMDGKNQTKFSAITEEVDSLKSHIQKVEGKIDEIQKNLDKFLSLYEIVINQYNPFIEQQPTSSQSHATTSVSQIHAPAQQAASSRSDFQQQSAAGSQVSSQSSQLSGQSPQGFSQQMHSAQSPPTQQSQQYLQQPYVQSQPQSGVSAQGQFAQPFASQSSISSQSGIQASLTGYSQPAHSQLLSQVHDIVDVIDKVKSISPADFTQLQPHLVQWSQIHLQDPSFSEQLQLTTKQQDVLKLLIKKSLKLNMSGL
jgi:archaellum component FlaC